MQCKNKIVGKAFGKNQPDDFSKRKIKKIVEKNDNLFVRATQSQISAIWALTFTLL